MVAKCPSCKFTTLKFCGPIAPSTIFAGRMLDELIDGGGLWQCASCQMAFRYPRPPKAVIDQLYCSGSSESWQTHAAFLSDWRLVKEWLKAKTQVKRVLDVGCFDGRLLEHLGPQYDWLGVEVHGEAAALARSRGVEVVCDDFDRLSESPICVDVALAIDVIEHAYDPRKFLELLASRVRPGGFIVITTGNTEAFMGGDGSRYWYCHIAEHLSFINPTWARLVAPALGLEIEYPFVACRGQYSD